MKKIVLSIVLAFVNLCLFSQNMNIGLLNGPSCIPCAYLQENVIQIDGTELEYEVFASPQDLLPKMIKKEVDIGFMPLNVAAKVFNSTNKGIICCGITGKGNLALITKDKKIKSLKDLSGKTVYIAGQGATPEYITKYILNKENIEIDTQDGITLEYSIPTNQLVPQLLAGKIDYAIVPEPFVTIAIENSKNKIYTLDLQKNYFEKYSTENYPLTVMVVRSEFAKENPHLVNQFLNKYETALNWTLKNPDKAGELCEKFQLGLKKEVVEKSIPKANYTYISANDGKTIIETMLQIIMEDDKAFLNGQLPSQDFYYINE